MSLRQRVSSPFLDSFAVLASALPLFGKGGPTPTAAAPAADAPGTKHAVPAGTLRRSLRLSSVEGIAAEVVTACAGGYVFTAWALHLHLSAVWIATLAAFPFFAQFAQLPGAWLTSVLGHRRAALLTVTASRQVLWVLVVLPWLPLSDDTRRAALLVVASLAAVFGVLGNNAWVAWMGELVPLKLRGRYFGRRTGIITVGTMVASIAAGLWLDRARAQGTTDLTLSLLAGVAGVAGTLTTVLLFKQHDPSPTRPVFRLSFRTLAAPFRDSRARAVLWFQALWNLGIGVASTFFTLYILKTLGLGFGWLAVYNGGIAVLRFLLAPLWGRALDRFGVRPVLSFCSFALAGLPLWWLVNPGHHLVAFLAVDVFASGVFWSGHGIATFALPLAMAPREGRPFYLAAFASAGGLAYGLASLLGGAVVQTVPAAFTLGGVGFVSFQVVFALSSVARLAGAFATLRLQDTRCRSLEELVLHVRNETTTRIRNTVRAPLHLALRAASRGPERKASAERARRRRMP